MTKEEIIVAIRNEVQRQRNMFIDDEYYTTLTDSLDEILEFIDNLKPALNDYVGI